MWPTFDNDFSDLSFDFGNAFKSNKADTPDLLMNELNNAFSMLINLV